VILMIVAGTKKAGAVRHARDAPLDLARFPAQLLREAGERVGWMIDRAASSDG
jgi:6-phosphogluconolactonase/glucosamine-6-phosphate isomerase/deaminase